jgi:hypothetical protein
MNRRSHLTGERKMARPMPNAARTRSYLESFVNFYEQSPPALGVADVCSANPDHSVDRAAAFAFFMLMARSSDEGRAVKRIVVVLPPVDTIPSISDSAILGRIVDLAGAEFGRDLNADELSVIQNRVLFVSAADLTVGSAIGALHTATLKEVAILMRAASYRDQGIAVRAASPTAFVLKEDQWVFHLTQLAHSCVDYAKAAGCYVLIDSGELSPQKESNRTALMSVSQCGYFTIVEGTDPAELVAAQADKWVRDVTEGRIGNALASIDALPAWMDSQKAVLKLQLLDRVAPDFDIVKTEVLQRLRSEIDARTRIDPSMGVKLARITQRAEDDQLASQILQAVAKSVTDQEDLELALHLAENLNCDDLAEAITIRLTSLFPASPKPFARALSRAVSGRKYTEATALLDSAHPPLREDLDFFYRTIATSLRWDQDVHYEEVIKTIAKKAPEHEEWARMICASEALERSDFTNAFRICLGDDAAILNSGAAGMLLRVTKRALLQRDSGGALIIDGDELAVPVASLIRYIALHPTDRRLRASLDDLLDAPITGLTGVSVAASIVLHAANATISPENIGRRSDQPKNEVDLLSFLGDIMRWMHAESPLILTLSKLPSHLLPPYPDATFDRLLELLDHQHDIRDSETANVFDISVNAAILLAPHTSTPNEDLNVIRHAAARHVAVNRKQTARDLAETALGLRTNGSERRRLAWLAYADVYHRCQNNIAALIGLACVFMSEAHIDVAQMWSETYLLIRVLRDLGLFDVAKEVVVQLRRVLDETHSPPAYARRLTIALLSIEVSELSQIDSCDRFMLAETAARVEAHCAELESEGEEMSPALSLVLQCMRIAELRGYPTSQTMMSLAHQLMLNGSPGFAGLMNALASPSVDGRELLALAQTVQPALNHEDVAFDLLQVAAAARRFLDRAHSRADADAVLLAIDLLGDYTIGSPFRESGASMFSSTAVMRQRILSLLPAGFRLVLLGLTEGGRLIRASFVCDELEEIIVEPHENFSAGGLQEWADHYPYGYSGADDPNVFWVSTDRLMTTLSGILPTVFVMDTGLQQFPPNAIRIRNDFAGRLFPVCSSPSVSWLSAIHNKELPGSHYRHAWIPTRTADEGDVALLWLAARIGGCLHEHAFTLNQAVAVPEKLRNSEIVVVAAHGRLLPEGRFIQRISATSEVAIYPEALASACAGSGVVILFICSGGRLDSHPGGQTTVGLVKQLLDRGCRSVIASPWPLDVKVPPHWIPAFMERWRAGDAIIDAVYYANARVAEILGGELVDCLAMNLFGDPFLRSGFRDPESE